MARVATRTRAAMATASPAAQKEIMAYGRTIKSAIAPSPLDAKKAAFIKHSATTTAPIAVNLNPKKRKAVCGSDEPSSDTDSTVEPVTPVKVVKRVRIQEHVDSAEVKIPAPIFTTPSKPTLTLPFSGSQTPTSTEKRVTRTPRSGRTDSARVSKRTVKKTIAPPNNSRIEDFFKAVRRKTKSGLPVEFDDFLGLHTAFMRTVVLQIAHNGSSDILKLREVLPQVTRYWGKRLVTIEDMRRIVAIQTYNGCASPFDVMEFGSLMCLRLTTDRAIDVAAVCNAFEQNLRALCTERISERVPMPTSAEEIEVSFDSLSLSDLPQAPIKRQAMTTAPKATRPNVLEQLRAAVARPAHSVIPTTDPTTGKPLTMLQRIRLKEAAARQNLNSTADMARKDTLLRAEHIAGTLEMMLQVNGMSRQSFPLAAAMVRIIDSFPSPLGQEEARACLDIIAKDVAPEFIKVLNVRGREFLVMERDMFPGTSVIHNRIAKLIPA
ncbi:hypothetical protein HOO65_080316 [Ceratocystis lukuohia]|uniref:DNA replication factor Cdt1 C-terminal domain-containing protein n=1 Tax=Ceratocystis lukuohia TaxID=2019550 RepID=A0ABR4MAQ8_9PEZI